MGIRGANQLRYSTFEEGLDDTSSIDSPDVQNTLSKADNCDLVDDSIVKKRNGYTAVNTAWSTRRIRQGFEYQRPDGTREVLVYGEAATPTGTSGILGKLSGSGVPTTITDTLADACKPSIVQFRTQAFIFNGFSNLVYDGTSTRAPGIPAPAAAPTLVTTIAGDKNTGSTYFIVYTYKNTVTGTESSPSPASEIFTTGATAAGAGFRIQVTPGSASLANKIRVYCSTAGGQTAFFEADFDISSTQIDLTAADSSLGDELELDNSQLVSPGRYAVVADNRIFVAGFSNNPNRIQYSKIGLAGSMPESFQIADFVDCNINDGDRIVGIAKVGTVVIVLKERSVGKLIRISAQGIGLERSGSQKYIYEEISSEVTGISHHAMTTLDNVVIWLGRDDVYATDGNTIARFGRRIRRTLRGLNFSAAWKFSGINKVDTQQVIFSTCRGGAAEPDFQIVAHYRNYPKVAFTYYTSGPNTTTHPGLRAASLFGVTVNSTRQVYFGSSSNDGLVHWLGRGDSDNGSGIYWDMRYPWRGVRNQNEKAVFHSYFLYVVGTGVSPNNVITASFEANAVENNVVFTQNFSLISSGANWNEADWSEFNWGGVEFTPIKFYPKKRAYYGRCGFLNSFANQPIAVKAAGAAIQEKAINQ